MQATVISSLLQQRQPKARIDVMEAVDIQLPVFAAGSTRSHSDFYNSTSPKSKKHPTSRHYGSSYGYTGPSKQALASKAPANNHPPSTQSVTGSPHSTLRVPGQSKGRGSLGSTSDGQQRRRGKYSNNLPPRIRNEMNKRQANKHVGDSTTTHSTVTIPDTNGKGTHQQSKAQVVTQLIREDKVGVSQPVTHMDVDTQVALPRKQLDKTSSSDSGVCSCDCVNWQGEDLSSSCESNVFEEQSPLESTQAAVSLLLPVSEIINHLDPTPTPCETTPHSDTSQSSVLVPLSLSRCSSTGGSEVDDDIFEDALSYLPVDRLISATSSTTSSAFVTPASTRSQSPVNTAEHSPGMRNGLTMSLQNSLKLLAKEHNFNLVTTSSKHSPEESLTCDSHVTLVEHHVTVPDTNGSPPCPYSFQHCSSIFDDLPDGASSKTRVIPKEVFRPSIADHKTVFVGEIEVEVDSSQYDNSFTFELLPSPSKLNDQEQDSGCGMSIGSPYKSSIGTKSRYKRPGLIHIPRESRLSTQVNSQSQQIPRGSFEFSSLSTASPKSSICSHTSSPLSLSPSPTPPIPVSSNTNESFSSTQTNDALPQHLQDWPEFESFKPVSHPQVPHFFPHIAGPPYMNGITHPREAPLIESERHQPTPEEILRMKQWHFNLMAQLRQQQERLDQKKKEKQLTQQIHPPPAPHQHEHQGQFLLHGVLPPQCVPQGPPPLHGMQGPLPYGPLPPHDPQGPLRPPPPFLHDSLPPPLFGNPPPPHHPPPHMVFGNPPPHHILMPPRGADFHGFPPHPPPPSQSTHPHSHDWPANVEGIHKSIPKPDPQTPPPKSLPCVEERTVHPLCDKWVMWYDKIMGSHRNSYSDYKASLKKINTMASVEDFWKLLNNLKPPSMLEGSANYHFFKEGVHPLWEDPANKHGGKWVLTVKDKPMVLDRAWIEVLLMLIGGCMGKKNLVNGVVVSRRRKGDRIAIWTNQKGKKSNIEICKDLIGALSIACEVPLNQLPTFVRNLSEFKNGLGLVFMHNTDSLKSRSSYQNESHIKLRDHVEDILREFGC